MLCVSRLKCLKSGATRMTGIVAMTARDLWQNCEECETLLSNNRGMTMRGRATTASPSGLRAFLLRAAELLKLMRKRRSQIIALQWSAFLAVASVLLGGCGGAAMNPEEFRQQVAGGPLGSVDRLDVDRSLRDVAAAFR